MLQLNKSFNTQQLTQFPPHNSQENIFSLPHPKEKKWFTKLGHPLLITPSCVPCSSFGFIMFHTKKSIAQVAKPKRFESIKPPNSSSLGNFLMKPKSKERCYTSLKSNGQLTHQNRPPQKGSKRRFLLENHHFLGSMLVCAGF